MKKILLILAITLISINPSFARNGLSVGLGLGVNPDPGGMQKIIHSGFYIPGVVSSYADLQYTNPTYIKNIKEDGVSAAPELSAHLRYDFFGFLFIKGGANYTKMISNTLSWQYTGSSQLGLPPSPDSTHKQTYDYTSFAVPVTFGINIPVEKGKYNFYLGTGPVISRVNYKITIDVPPYAFNALNSSGTDIGISSHETINYNITVLGMNLLIGSDIKLTADLYLFAEIQFVYVLSVKDDSAAIPQILFSRSSTPPPTVNKNPSGLDFNSSQFRFGVRYNIF